MSREMQFPQFCLHYIIHALMKVFISTDPKGVREALREPTDSCVNP